MALICDDVEAHERLRYRGRIRRLAMIYKRRFLPRGRDSAAEPSLRKSAYAFRLAEPASISRRNAVSLLAGSTGATSLAALYASPPARLRMARA